MPGPVSDSYDPEFGTGENASIVCEAVTEIRDAVSKAIGNDALLPIVDLCRNEVDGRTEMSRLSILRFNERDLRILRFALNRALESL
jgi:hypothetical protein